MGKVYASPFTVAGSLVGGGNVLLANAMGDKRAGVSVQDNCIQFESGYLGEKNRAFRLAMLCSMGREVRRAISTNATTRRILPRPRPSMKMAIVINIITRPSLQIIFAISFDSV